MIGQRIGSKYVILRLLGEGGMGAVYEAENQGTGRHVALKVVNDAAAKRPGTIERFMREAKVVGTVDTQHIVQIFDAGADPASGCPYIAMELLAGEDVNQLIRRVGPITPDLALRIAVQACLGLAKAHAAGIIHRDIKPANLYLARRDAGEVIVKILDFGIAKTTATDAEAHRMTATGAALGSPSYMSPEQVKGLKTLDARTDLWSLGAVMYEMLTGLVPYHRAETIHQLIMAICGEAPPPLQDLAPWVPPEVVGVVDGAMQQEVARRFQSAVLMQEFIRRLLPGGSWTIHEGMLVPLDPRLRTTTAPRRALEAAPPGATTAVEANASTSAVAGSTASSSPTTSARPARSSLLVPIAAAAALAVTALVVGGIYKVTRGTASPAPIVAPDASAPSSKSEARTVRVRIPEGASAEVDGAASAVANGAIEVSGTPGSKHHVRVIAGDREIAVEVVVADDGASPDRIEFPAPPAPSASAPARSAVQGSQSGQPIHPATGAKPAKPASGVSTKFEL